MDKVCSFCLISAPVILCDLTGRCCCAECSKNLFKMSAHLYFPHVRSRVSERFGIDFSSIKYRGVIKKIQSGDSKFICRTSKRDSIHIVEVDGVRIPFVCRKMARASSIIKTALPRSFSATTADGQRFSMSV